MTIALILFALAAVGGLTLAYLRLKEQPLPMPLALAHGAFAASGIVALLLNVIDGAPEHAKIALGLFIVAALGGFLLFGLWMQKKQLPLGVIAVHALVAVGAFVLLLLTKLAA
jgi:hypothetical protein